MSSLADNTKLSSEEDMHLNRKASVNKIARFVCSR